VSDPTPPVWNAPSIGGAEPEPTPGPVVGPTPGAASPVAAAAPAPAQTQPSSAAPLPPGEPLPATSPVVRPSSARKISGGAAAVALSALVAVGGLGFAIGRVTAPTTTDGFANGRFGNGTGQFPGGGQLPGDGNGGAGGIGRGGFGGFTVSGTVTNVTGDQLTIKTSSGTEVTIPLDSSTAYHSQAAASSTDVTTGSNVQVQVQPDRTAAGQGGQGSGPTLGPATAVTIVGN